MPMQDLAGTGKAAVKLLGMLERAAVGLAKPWQIRRVAAAEADAAVTVASATARSGLVLAQGEIDEDDLRARAARRVTAEQETEQRNLEAIATMALNELPTTVTDAPVNDDWITRFLRHCREVSDPDVQRVWAKVLAGEVERPGHFSYRTLRVLADLRRQEAEDFLRACAFAWTNEPPGLPRAFIPWSAGGTAFMKQSGLTFDRLLMLADAGLVKLTPLALLYVSGEDSITSYGGRTFRVASSQDVSTPIIVLTVAGSELLELMRPEPVAEFEKLHLDELAREGAVVTPCDGVA